MQLFVLRRKLALLWKRRLVRAVIGLLVTAGFIFLQYWLVHIPLPIQLENSSVKIPWIRTGEELVITQPLLTSELVFAHNGTAAEFINVFLDKATIGDETRHKYPLDFGPRSVRDTINYTTGSTGSSKSPCTTAVELRFHREQEPLNQLIFFQSSGPGNENYRLLDVKADQPSLLVVITSPTAAGAIKGEPDADDDGPGCVKELAGAALAGKAKTFDGAFSVKSDVSANSKMSLRFLPADAGKPIWPQHDSVWEPFLTATPVFSTNQIAIRSTTGNQVPFAITAADKALPLWISKLKIGSDHLEVEIVGRGFVKIYGEPIPLDFWKLVQRYPAIATLFGILNLGLVTWLIKLFRGLFPAGTV
jgi:hypothetical protein